MSSLGITIGDAAGESDALFYFRPYHNDHKFLADYPTRKPFDCAILLGRHLAPYIPASKSAQRGLSGRELADSLTHSRAQYVVDPDSAVLAVVTPSTAPTPRVLMMPHAQAVSVPITPLGLAASGARVGFVQTAVAAQAGAAAVCAPYFQFDAAGDRWHDLNLKMIADAAPLAQGRPLVTFVQTPLSSLVSGRLGSAAQTYSGLGLNRIFVRVAGFNPAASDARTIGAYRRALDAFQLAGIPPVADAVGRFGLVVTAGGAAAGFSCGARHHHRVAEALVYDTDDMYSEPCRYEVPNRWYSLDHRQARHDSAAGLLPACPISQCDALAPSSAASQLREHLLHYFTREVRIVVAAGASTMRQHLNQYPAGSYTQAWLQAA